MRTLVVVLGFTVIVATSPGTGTTTSPAPPATIVAATTTDLAAGDGVDGWWRALCTRWPAVCR